jgi:glycosyltransferase involved in cell wall biosynthesis
VTDESPAVTVVVPALNAIRWIRPALESVFAQTYPHDRLDLVVVDDGSTDGTADKAAELLAAGNLSGVVLRNDSCRGPSAARNQGWQHGRGTWIQFLDADDVLAPDKLRLQVAAAIGSRPQAAAAFSRWGRLQFAGGRWVEEPGVREPRIGSDALLDLIRTENFIQLGSVVFSRDWLERVGGFDESRQFIEDIDLLMRIAIAGGRLLAVPSDAPVSWYRLRPDSLSRSSDGRFLEGCLRNARLAEQQWTAAGRPLTDEQASVLAEIYFFAARYYAEWDPSAFLAVEREIRRLKPGFLPVRPRGLRLLSRAVGYASAERLAVRWRRIKRLVRPPGAPGAAVDLKSTQAF